MGFYVPEPDDIVQAKLPQVVGPQVFLRVQTEQLWNAAVCVSVRDEVHAKASLRLTYTLGGNANTTEVPATVLADVLGWQILRFELAVRAPAQGTHIVYQVVDAAGAAHAGGEIPLAARRSDWNLVAYSCYDQRRRIGEVLWEHSACAHSASLLQVPAVQHKQVEAAVSVPVSCVPMWHDLSTEHSRSRVDGELLLFTRRGELMHAMYPHVMYPMTQEPANSTAGHRCGGANPLIRLMPAAVSIDGGRPLHALIGGGDQLYNDNVWALPETKAWLSTENHLAEQPSAELLASVERFYLESYLRCIHFHPGKRLLACTPQVCSSLENSDAVATCGCALCPLP